MFFTRRHVFFFTLILLSWFAVAAHAATPQIAAGYYHNVALKGDGTVWSWGYNGFGQLGNGGIVDSNTPVQVQGLSGVSAVAAGFFHSVALKSDGTVWLWGDNGYDQLGVAGLAYSNIPLQVAGVSNVVAVAAAGAHTMALKSDGSVWVWGWNAYGQLGIGGTGNARTPTPVPGLLGISGIAAGFFHSLAVHRDGTLSAWGYNGHGQLGNGGVSDAMSPLPVAGIDGVSAVAAGGGHTVALKKDGTVWAWGWNGFGQLGDGGAANSNVPLRVIGLNGIKAVAAGFFHSLALKSDGTVRAWGYNEYGQLGNGSTAASALPMPVTGLTGAVAIAGSNHHSAALKNDGSVLTWGWNDDGQLGDGSRRSAALPVTVLGTDGQGVLNLGVSSYQDFWNNPAQPGSGVGITQHGSTLFASWYSYDANGKPIWLVLPGGTWRDSTTYSGQLYSTSGQSNGAAFAPGKVEVTAVGTADLHFTDVDHMSLSYTYQGSTGVKQLGRYVFDSSGDASGVNRSDMWWTPAEPGSGLNITHQFQTIFAAWNTYDAGGKPAWYVLPGGSWLGPNTYSGTLYRTVSTPSGTALTQGAVSLMAAGSAMLIFTDADNAELRYEVDGLAGSKAITRQRF